MSRTTAESTSLTEQDNIRCQITAQIFFDPVIAVSNDDEQCGHCFEKEAIKQWMKQKQESGSTAKCPTCRAEIVLLAPALDKRNELDKVFSEYPKLCNEVYFDLAGFQKIFEETADFNTAIFRRYIALLEKADKHLNSVIHVLASTLPGRDLLRKKLKIESGKYFFGNAEISAESLQMQVNGKSICDWLSMTTAMDQFEINAIASMSAIEKEVEAIRLQKEKLFNQSRLFVSRGARGAAGQRIPSDAVNPTLQQVVYGNENAVRAALEAVKDNSAQLAALLSDIGTVKDYSDRTITGMTLLQAAAAAGDIDMCLMLKNYMPPEEFATQLTEIFPNGIEAHEEEQKRTAFNFDAILAAISAARPADLDAALNKIGAEFTQSDSARAKPDHELSLTEALNRFREQFAQHSRSEKIFNPHHLLRAFEVYNALWERCERDGSDPDYKKRDLFWRQIIGYTQRFMPACYAQAFSQGLCYLVKVDQDDSWRPEAFKRDLKLRCDDFSYFPLPLDSRSDLGFDFAICGGRNSNAHPGLRPYRTVLRGPIWWRELFSKTYVEQKHQAFRTLCREFECGDLKATSSLINVGV